MIDPLFKGNRLWSERIKTQDPDFFLRLSKQQAPDYFWIGCSDSRVPANVIAGLDPGEVFVHRNVANVVHASDMNLLSTLEFAVDTLNISQIIVCGHYGCGGVKAACEDGLKRLADHWLEPIRRVSKENEALLRAIDNPDNRLDRLAELNVKEGVQRVADTPIIRNAWKRGMDVRIHGLIYDIHDGVLRNLDCTIKK